MELTFVNPGIEAMLESIMAFQTDDSSAFWMQPLYHFYPQLDSVHAASLPFPERKAYLEETLRTAYAALEETLNQKTILYAACWEKYKKQIIAALSDAFEIDCALLFNDLQCRVSMNPVSPRFLEQHCFEVFYLNSERGAIGVAIHEMIHFVWFHVWHRVFGDCYEEYEAPSLKWILSEMVVEPIMRDERLSSINPYFPRENGGCIYPYFFDMKADGKPILDTMDMMYRDQSIENFMRNSYLYCLGHETEIRAHIRRAEQ